jgi:hypothetical protein
MLSYLGELEAWLNERRSELDSLDAQIISGNRQAELNADITLAMTIWQSIKTRQGEILKTWDSGRVTQVELEKLSSLIFGRLDSAEQQLASMAVSLPEAGKLCDALVASLRNKLNTDPGVENQLARIRAARSGLERVRDQIALEPPALRPGSQAKLDALLARLQDIDAKRSRGADVGGLLGPLEAEAAKLERDLIVGGAQRRQAVGLLEQVRKVKAAVESEELSLRAAEADAATAVWPVPEGQVPSVASLGALPNTPDALSGYQSRLEQLRSAQAARRQQLEEALGQPPAAEHLLGQLATRAAKFDDDPVLEALYHSAKAVLDAEPTVIPVLQHAIAAYQAKIDQLTIASRP